MEALFNVEAWQSPGGVGVFLVCLGAFLYLVTHIDTNKK